MSKAGRSRRADRGATLVEYALIFSLLVVACIGAAQFVEDETGKEADKQADCISTRPPPPSCQLAPIDAVGGGAAGNGGPNGGGGTPTTKLAAVTYNGPATAVASGGKYDITVDVDLADDLAAPLPGETMTAQVTILGSTPPGRAGQFFYVDCTTNAAGKCIFAFDSRFASVDSVSFDIVTAGVDTNYEFGDFPAITIARP